MSLMLLKRAASSLHLNIKLGLGAFTTPQYGKRRPWSLRMLR